MTGRKDVRLLALLGLLGNLSSEVLVIQMRRNAHSRDVQLRLCRNHEGLRDSSQRSVVVLVRALKNNILHHTEDCLITFYRVFTNFLLKRVQPNLNYSKSSCDSP